MQNKSIEGNGGSGSQNCREEELYAIHKRLCEDLNMDMTATEKSWQSYRSISYNYTLNGNQNHWLCCAIFVACRRSITPTVGDQSSTLEGNCVSLTRLLRICNISIYEFFQKIKQWMEMSSSPKSFRNKVERLERSFAVSVLLYRKLGPIFEDLFNCAKTEERSKSNKKSKPLPCSATKLYELAWCLFVYAKGEYKDHSVDLVTSFDMLLCCCDLIYANVIYEKRHDLINSKFTGLPEDWNTEDFDPSIDSLCIVNHLCQLYEGSSVDALHAKQYVWKPVIEKLFKKNILKGDSKTFMNLIAPGNFEQNLKSLNNVYETYVLSCGEVDERIFLKHFQFGSRNFGANGTTSSTVVDETIQSLVPQTPLTGRNYLQGRDPVAPLSIAHDNVSKLRAVFGTYQGEVPAGLKELFGKVDPDSILHQLQERLNEMSTKFIEQFPFTDRWKLVEALYYHLLQNILEGELKIRPGLDIKVILREDSLHRTLIICCIEIVVYSFNPQRRFPTVLQWYQMHPFNFYKIIEMVVLYHQDSLTRDIIKHLNMIEEQTLESFAWESCSPLWERIKTWGCFLPLCQDVDKPKMIGDQDLAGITPHNPNFCKSDIGDKKIDMGFLASPSGQTVKKQLFQDEKPTLSDGAKDNGGDTPKALSQELPMMINGSQGDVIQSSQDESRDSNSHLLASTKKSNRAGSLGLFFRKFYKLASVRMLALCNGLELNDPDLLKKIWTVFEHSIVEQIDLMKDRHLDQMIMCAIYVIFRVTKQKKNFKDIMYQYRSQPQWASHVYRSVLIEQRNDNLGGNNDTKEAGTPEKQGRRYEPGDLAGTSQRYENEVRGDIILFYNTVYVKKMQAFAMKFAENTSKESLLLSPLPHNPNQIMSPKKVSEHHQIYIQPLGKNILKSPGPNKCITYQFPISPMKDSPSKTFMEINRIVNQTRSTKRPILNDDDNTEPSPFERKLSKVPRKLESLISDRQGQNH